MDTQLVSSFSAIVSVLQGAGPGSEGLLQGPPVFRLRQAVAGRQSCSARPPFVPGSPLRMPICFPTSGPGPSPPPGASQPHPRQDKAGRSQLPCCRDWSGRGQPAQHELGVLLHVMGSQASEQRLHDVGQVLELAVQCQGQQRSHEAAVPLGEAGLLLQGVDELGGSGGGVLALTPGSPAPHASSHVHAHTCRLARLLAQARCPPTRPSP